MVGNILSLCYEYVAPMHSRQLSLSFVNARSKCRRGAVPARGHVPHRVRPAHGSRHPVHVTFRRARHLPSLRAQSLFLSLQRALSRTARSWFRVVQFSVQADHVHLLVEALDKGALSRGMTGLLVRLARAFNRALGRRGGVWSGRFHSRALRTPREVRNGLVYVLMNHRKHAAPGDSRAMNGLDACSSAVWFEGWAGPPSPGPPLSWHDPQVALSETWLARIGWKRHGLIRFDESPKGSRTVR